MRPLPENDCGCRFPIAFRGLIAVSQITTVFLTWKLWGIRDYPPLLPLLPVPQFDMALLMLASVAVSFFFPRYGLPIQAAALLWSFVSDQARIQPYMLSMFYLSCGTIPRCWGGVVFARASLVSLWCFSGIHKLTSPDFFTNTMPWLLGAMGLPRAGVLPLLCGAGVGILELLLGISCLIPCLRKAVAAAAFVVHMAIFVMLSPMGINWNPEVLPWNAVLAAAGFTLIACWKDRPIGLAWQNCSLIARVAAIVLLVSPVGYWLGVVDAYLAHCLYSGNTPQAFVCNAFGRRNLLLMSFDEGVPVPPAHRLFEPLFLGMGRSGEWLEIEDPRWVSGWLGRAPRKVFWSQLLPEGGEIIVPGGGDDASNGDSDSG